MKGAVRAIRRDSDGLPALSCHPRFAHGPILAMHITHDRVFEVLLPAGAQSWLTQFIDHEPFQLTKIHATAGNPRAIPRSVSGISLRHPAGQFAVRDNAAG